MPILTFQSIPSALDIPNSRAKAKSLSSLPSRADSPCHRVFTKGTRMLAAHLCKSDIIFQSINDWLVIVQSSANTVDTMQHTFDLNLGLSYIANKNPNLHCHRPQSSSGQSLDLQWGTASPIEVGKVNLHLYMNILLSSQLAPAREGLRLIGLIASVVDLILRCR